MEFLTRKTETRGCNLEMHINFVMLSRNAKTLRSTSQKDISYQRITSREINLD